MSKIFVRERRKAKKGGKKPGFTIVGVADTDLKIFETNIRLAELEKLTESIGAEIVYLPRSDKSKEKAPEKE